MRVQAEMRDAYASRARGNEGRARVCARRAVGMALAGHWSMGAGMNAYDLLLRAASSPGFAEGVREAAARLTVRVTEDHQLPHAEDPLGDARLILVALGYTIAPDTDGRVAGDAQST